jgi:uncharacterized protein (DUF1684 family)
MTALKIANPGRMGAYEQEILAWRAARLARLTAETGWLSIIGRHELREGKNAVEGVGDVLVERGVVTLGGRRITPDSPITDGDLLIELLERPDGPKLRVKDKRSRARLDFPGIEYFAIDPAWRKIARFQPYAPVRVVELDFLGGAPESFEAPGVCIFEHEGKELSLEPVLDTSRPRLYLLFRDETNKSESYGAGRFLYAPLPDAGRTVLDFNQAFNPPCAFNPFVTCPIAPPHNRLSLRVPAGEQRPRDKEDAR